jgi:hypothetical protein
LALHVHYIPFRPARNWDNLTAQEKMNALQQMVRQQAARAVPALLRMP